MCYTSDRIITHLTNDELAERTISELNLMLKRHSLIGSEIDDRRTITYAVSLLQSIQREQAERENPKPLTTKQLVKLDIAYFTFEDEDLKHLNGWRVRRYCPQTEGHEFIGKEGSYVDSRYYKDGNNGYIAYATEPKGEAT